MERRIFSKKSLNGQRPRVDRFVPPRATFPELRQRMAWGMSEATNRTIDYGRPKDLQKKKYISYLNDAFGLDAKTFGAVHSKKDLVQSWPCVPRKKGYLSTADSILDLPNYSKAAFPELLDWGSDNILVAALGKNYHKWSWRTQSVISLGLAQSDILSCKIDPRGEILTLGTRFRNVEIHDNLLNKVISTICCNCGLYSKYGCSITAVNWSPTGNSFATGCSQGMIVSFSRTARPIHWCPVATGPILSVRVSPNARYLAVTAIDCEDVMLFAWPEIVLITCVGFEWTVKNLCWHPWRSALLGIGATTETDKAHIVLWDTNSDNIEPTLNKTNHILDVMMFSHRTGEMVISLWNADPANSYQKMGAQLMVLNGLQEVVDHYGEDRHALDRIRTMVFSPDGTKLATATTEEDLIIWNFLPEEKEKKMHRKRFSDLPVYLDKAMHGYSVR